MHKHLLETGGLNELCLDLKVEGLFPSFLCPITCNLFFLLVLKLDKEQSSGPSRSLNR